MALSLGIRGPGAEKNPRMQAARAKVFAACKANKIFFLNSMNVNNVIDMIKEGVMVGPASQEAAEIGRKYTKSLLANNMSTYECFELIWWRWKISLESSSVSGRCGICWTNAPGVWWLRLRVWL
jgi:hypothetical protein